MKTRIAGALIGLIASTAILIGCSSQAGDVKQMQNDTPASPGGVIVEVMPDGRNVYCVAILRATEGTALSCNWEGYNNK